MFPKSVLVCLFRIIFLVDLTYDVAWFILGIISNFSILSLSVSYFSASIVFLAATWFMISDELRETLFRHVQSVGVKLRQFKVI